MYEEEAIEAIFNLSAGHPYFTQVVCLTLFELARSREQYNISCQDVCNSNIVEKIFKDDQACAGLTWFWDGLTPEQQVIFAAAAETLPQQPLMLLKSYGIVPTEYLDNAYDQLVKYKFLDETKVKVKIELVRRWLVEKHNLKDEINNLEKFDEEDVNKLLSAADRLRQENDPLALQIYEKALKINPNNFTTVMSLAEEYLKIGQLNQAHKFYKRAYQFYSINNKQETVLQPLLNRAKKYSDEENIEQALEIYVLAYQIYTENSKHPLIATAEDYGHQLTESSKDALKYTLIETAEDYGHQLILERKWTDAEAQFKFVLEIDRERKISQQKLKEIQVLKSKTNLNVEDTNTNYVPVNKPSRTMPKWLNRSSIPIASLALAGIVFIGAGISQVFRTCPTGERKELGVFCVVDNTIINARISRGDRTFFPETTNIPRDKGIQAFKKGDYPRATNLFQEAVKADQNNPEVLIYYNNSLARQQGSQFTLAVVVPLDKNTTTTTDTAKEILRGVAQAQNQFNSNKGLNGRLLEIVIANDSNKEKAKEVAQELIKDPSILGVVGHKSSDATKEALPEYEKAKLAVVSPTSTSILLNSPVFFRAVYSDESAGKKLAEYTYKNLKLKKAVIFANPNSPYSHSIREIFTNQFEKLGGEVVHKPLIDLTATTFDAEKEVAKSVYSDNAEAALLFPDTESTDIALKIAKEITKRNERLKTRNSPRRELKMLGGDTLYQGENLSNGGKDVEGLIVAVPWFRETPQAQPFAKKADTQWGGGISWRTATSFDATWMLIKALSNNPSRSTVLGRLENVSLSANETSGYPLKFTPKRERQGESILVQIKGGDPKQIDTVKP
jgi:ABC-type branched-subunit amino acid transport system substrate-binding protein